VVSIPACHAGDLASIPGLGAFEIWMLHDWCMTPIEQVLLCVWCVVGSV
jgi:hypothetical protein